VIFIAGNKDKISEYRRGILRQLNDSQKIVELVNQVYNEDEPISYTNKNFFPYEYVPAQTQTDKTFVCFDMAAKINRNKTYHDFTIWFFISTHTSTINIPTGLRYDKIVAALDEIFEDKNVLGVGKGMFTDNSPYNVNNDFRGRVLTYKIIDLSRGG
jgi:hypothetical protein